MKIANAHYDEWYTSKATGTTWLTGASQEASLTQSVQLSASTHSTAVTMTYSATPQTLVVKTIASNQGTSVKTIKLTISYSGKSGTNCTISQQVARIRIQAYQITAMTQAAATISLSPTDVYQ